jgi:sarcosine oxidase
MIIDLTRASYAEIAVDARISTPADTVASVADPPNADVIVVGLGAMGAAVSHHLAARGASVLGIDRFTPPHPYGSTHGDTRITRLAIGEGAAYVPLVQRSHQLWRNLERRASVELLTRTGGLILAHPESEFLAETQAAARQYGIEHERLSNADVVTRFPVFAVDDRVVGYYEPEAGYVRPEAAVAAQLDLARRDGAQLRLGELVIGWSASPEGVRVRTDAGEYSADQLVLCPGPWINELFPQGRHVFAVYRQVQYWFPIRERYEQLRALPIFVWDFGGEQDAIVHLNGFYGFPALDGPDGGLKVATESYGQTTEPDGAHHPATRAEIDEMYRRCVGPRLRGLGPEPLRTVSCLYTCTSGSRFVIDRHPDHERAMIVSACSGHGFKHSPAIGEAVAQWCSGEQAAVDLAPFALAPATSEAGSS